MHLYKQLYNVLLILLHYIQSLQSRTVAAAAIYCTCTCKLVHCTSRYNIIQFEEIRGGIEKYSSHGGRGKFINISTKHGGRGEGGGKMNIFFFFLGGGGRLPSVFAYFSL